MRHDVRRRVSTYQSWADVPSNKFGTSEKSPKSRQKAKPVKSKPPPPAFTTMTNPNDIILSLLDENYKEIMWAQYRKLGRMNGSYDRENEVGQNVLFSLKKGMGTRGRFFKKSPHNFDLIECSEEVALEKIKSDLKRRMSSKHHWLGEVEKSAVAINRYPSRGVPTPVEVDEEAAASPTKTSSKKAKPKSYDSPYKKRYHGLGIPPEPAVGFPDGWVTRQVPRAKTTDKRLDRFWYSPTLGLAFRNRDEALQFASEVERVGGDEAKVVGLSVLPSNDNDKDPGPKVSAPEVSDATKEPHQATNRPLAPIFLKNYSKKKKAADLPDNTSEDVPSKFSRYPERKRKCTSSSESAAIVTDDTDSVSSMEATDEPRRKKAKI